MLLTIFGTSLALILQLSYIIFYLDWGNYQIQMIASDIAWNIPTDDTLLFWLCVGGIPFVINLVATMISKNPISAIVTLITPVVQYIINFQMQWYVWLDPSDGDPCWLEYIEYGIWLPFLSACIFGLVFCLAITHRFPLKKIK